jgi:signal-transduction protein with cAMP-binding, CBS, and nucleotidyltransferase domain
VHDELAEIRDFLEHCPPFDGLDRASLAALTRHFVIRYLRRGATFPPDGNACLWLIRQGAIELRTADGQLARRMAEGDVHDAACLPDSVERQWSGRAVEDTLLYGLPQADLEQLGEDHLDLRQQALDRSRAAPPPGSARRGFADRTRPRQPAACHPRCSLAGLRKGNRDDSRGRHADDPGARFSPDGVVDGGRLCGIVTDRDLRSRRLAPGLPDNTPLSAIMTPNPCTLPPDAPGFEAVLAMTHRGIHRLPVVEHGRLHGLVSSTDLLRAQGVSSVHPADRIRRAGDLAELVGHAAELPDLWFNLARRSETTPVLGRIVSGIADAPVGCSPWPRCAVVRRPCLTPGSSMARLASNLFDFRVVHGDEQLGRPLRRQIARNCPQHDTLFVHLVANACSIPPPLGFFRQLVVIGEGEREGDLDIKRHGLLPIVDLARIHALAAGARETGTLPRLRAAAAGKLLSQDGAETLGAAFEFLLALRTCHQKEQLSQGLRADNFVASASLSTGDRQALRDVFLAVARQQKALQLAFPHAPAQMSCSACPAGYLRLSWRRRWQARRLRGRAAAAPLLAQLDAPLADPRQDWRSARYLALDLETTGGDPQRDDILSFGWVGLEGPEIRLDGARHRLVLPRRALNEASVTIHRIFTRYHAA